MPIRNIFLCSMGMEIMGVRGQSRADDLAARQHDTGARVPAVLKALPKGIQSASTTLSSTNPLDVHCKQVSIYGLMDNVVRVFFGSGVGGYIDRCALQQGHHICTL